MRNIFGMALLRTSKQGENKEENEERRIEENKTELVHYLRYGSAIHDVKGSPLCARASKVQN